MKLKTKVAYNTIIQLAGKVIATALGLIVVAIITRHLGQEGFGEYITIFTFLSFFGIIADLGLTLITVQMISQPDANQNKILGNLLGLRLVSAIIFLGIAPLMVIFFPYSSQVKIGVLIAAVSLLCIALNQILVGLFQKHLRLDKVSIAEVLGRASLVVGVIIVLKLGYGLLGIVIVTAVSSIINFVLLYLFSLSLARIKLRFDFDLWRKIIIRSWPLAITIVLNLIYLKTDTLLLSLLSRQSEIGIIAEVGLYGAAYRVIDVLITFPFMFAGIILPILTASWASKKYDDFKAVLQKSFDVMIILAIPIIIGTQPLAKEIMVLVAGDEFAGSGPILQVLIGAAVMIYIGVMFSHAIIAINKQRQIIGAYLFTAVTAVIGYLIIIPRFSYFGAAWVTIYSELAITLAAIYLIWKYTKFIPNLNITLKSLLASGIMLGAIYSLQKIGNINILLISLAAFLVYSLALFLFKGISKQDIQSLLNK